MKEVSPFSSLQTPFSQKARPGISFFFFFSQSEVFLPFFFSRDAKKNALSPFFSPRDG